MKLPAHVSESVKRLNPELYSGVCHTLGSVQPSKRERNAILPLDKAVKAKRQREGRVVVCVSLINFRARELDGDNLQTALKPTRDAIAASLGIDDRDVRVRWQYGQVQTRGQEGVLVRIETV